MNNEVKPTILVVSNENNTKKVLQFLSLARSFMMTVVVYSYFDKAIERIKKSDNFFNSLYKKTKDNKEE